MKEITIPAWKSFLFSELWKILEWREGCVYKTKTTGKYISNKTTIPEGYITSVLSTEMTKGKDEITLPLWEEE